MASSIIPNNNLKANLLWTNNDISSEFAVQNVSLDLSKYHFLFITFILNASATNYTVDEIVNIDNERKIIQSINFDGNTNKICARSLTANTTNIRIYSGYYYEVYGTTTKNDNYLVPYKIYGII